jgi:hypothetical protein
MSFEENQIFNCSNADNAKIGNVVVGANSVEGLMWKVKKAKNVELETDTLIRVLDNKKFLVRYGFGDRERVYSFIYQFNGIDPFTKQYKC